MNSTRYSVGGLAFPDHQPITLGPRHPTSAGLITLAVDTEADRIVAADVTSGYGHRGAEKLFEVRDYRAMIMLGDRHDWLAAFSGELSLTLTLENAMRLSAPPRAIILRTLLAELARIHSHLSFLSYLSSGTEPNERLWRVVEEIRSRFLAWTGNRVHPMLNRVGGLATDAPDGWLATLDELLDDVARLSADLRAILDRTSRFSGLGILDQSACLGFGLTGPVARAAGFDPDRRADGYLAYGSVFRPVHTRTAGDAEARLGVLIDEVGTSVDMIRVALALAAQTPGEVNIKLSRRLRVPEGQHSTDIEAPWGIASCLMNSRGGQTPWRVALRTPSFANVSALGKALEGATTAQIPDVIASLGYSIGDLDK
ncbi:NADH-quinone oxidoreductase subunit D [Tessaracoccus sp. MC1865]|uniref:NADH-quinone oxidoreductase subunit D n=1 Tax=unclassified Tessaracoccus TaxID=2635419 RepID=UPI001602B815|nr:NADH-quinone oxidoreductase subunit D [Tessaracoccus sp. MC1865]MBB1484015.1 NADH-quinone oxidoreductase subunit D [Tessaracoccus sp. MC1865]MBB1508477.1 NADH-quinone oxidoreductase subunit D [Tessaracoccus sp. MC1756]QTO37056.1 NADH-quinone oxidoreductase subunit D [Tessaracoccus sp. MC1865]